MASLSADGVKPVLGSDRFRRQEQHCLSSPVSHVTKSYESWYNAKDIFRQDMHGLVHRIYHLPRYIGIITLPAHPKPSTVLENLVPLSAKRLCPTGEALTSALSFLSSLFSLFGS